MKVLMGIELRSSSCMGKVPGPLVDQDSGDSFIRAGSGGGSWWPEPSAGQQAGQCRLLPTRQFVQRPQCASGC